MVHLALFFSQSRSGIHLDRFAAIDRVPALQPAQIISHHLQQHVLRRPGEHNVRIIPVRFLPAIFRPLSPRAQTRISLYWTFIHPPVCKPQQGTVTGETRGQT